LGVVAAGFGLAAMAASAQAPPTWASVGPIFAENCVRCHGGSHPTGLDLRTYESTIAGSNRGAVLIAGNPDQSLLMQRITGTVTPQMPRGAPALSPDQIALIAAWIAGGLQP
jgi:mono/diheme cytochrome c family protein